MQTLRDIAWDFSDPETWAGFIVLIVGPIVAVCVL